MRRAVDAALRRRRAVSAETLEHERRGRTDQRPRRLARRPAVVGDAKRSRAISPRADALTS